MLFDKCFIHWPSVLSLNHPFAIYEKAGGDAPYVVSLGHSTVFIQQNGERQALSLSENLHNFPPFTDIHRQDGETLVFVLLVSLLQSGPLCTAVRSPGGPEIEKHDLASQLTQSHLVAV